MKKHSVTINIIGIIIMICLLMIGINEAEKYVNKIDWEPTEIYEFANKNIEWTH